MSNNRSAITKLAEALELPVSTVLSAALPAYEEPSPTEIDGLAAEFDRVVAPVLSSDRSRNLLTNHLFAIRRYVEDARATLSDETRGLLKTSVELRQALSQLVDNIAARPGNFVLAPVAAASDGDLTQRRFEGGLVSLVPDEAHATQFFLVVELDEPRSHITTIEIANDVSGELAKIRLDESGEGALDGALQTLIDRTDPEVDRFVRLFRIPTSKVCLLR